VSAPDAASPCEPAPYLDERRTVAPHPASTPAGVRTATGGAALSVEHLTKRFGGITAVNDVSFDVAPGQAVAVIGPNGAGKSSLLKLLSGAYRPDEGTIRFGEIAVENLAGHQAARQGIALAYQIPRPFKGLTVRENIAIGAMARPGGPRGRTRYAAVETVLETCGLADKASLPASALRLLDLKRLELARALSVDPSLILLDEVAAGLNGRDLEEVIELIRAIHSQGRSLILVEHVEGVVASLVDRVLVIDWGRVIAEGTPGEIAADPKVREVYLGAGHAGLAGGEPRPPRPPNPTPLLRANALTTAYGDIVALREVDIEVDAGEIVAVLGANGAGKSTLAGTLSGALRATSGQITFAGRDTGHEPAFARNRDGIAHCPEGRKIFAELTVAENLSLPGGLRLRRAELHDRLDAVHDIFPMLQQMASRRAGELSGGQQQMLAIGRALMSRPRLLLCDEISLGLAPVAIDALYEALVKIRDRGVAVVLIEQNVHRALTVADRVYVLDRGRVSYSGEPGPLTDQATLDGFYFGTSTALTAHHDV
jgi:branched-chain amino acid transport system ATP-binding protein